MPCVLFFPTYPAYILRLLCRLKGSLSFKEKDKAGKSLGLFSITNLARTSSGDVQDKKIMRVFKKVLFLNHN